MATVGKDETARVESRTSGRRIRVCQQLPDIAVVRCTKRISSVGEFVYCDMATGGTDQRE